MKLRPIIIFPIIAGRWLVMRYQKYMGIGVYRMSETRHIEDAITSALAKLVHQKKISQDRADWWMEEFAYKHGLSGLLPRPLRGEALKIAIRQRIYGISINGHIVDLYQPVPLPDRNKSLEEMLFGKIRPALEPPPF